MESWRTFGATTEMPRFASAEGRAAMAERRERAHESVRLAHRAGVLIAAGTDFGGGSLRANQLAWEVADAGRRRAAARRGAGRGDRQRRADAGRARGRRAPGGRPGRLRAGARRPAVRPGRAVAGVAHEVVTRTDQERFTGWIAGLGTDSGHRLVVGHWPRSPDGMVTDVMAEDPAGHRTLYAPTPQLAASSCPTPSPPPPCSTTPPTLRQGSAPVAGPRWTPPVVRRP